MAKFTVVIVEDEEPAIQLLSGRLAERDDIEVLEVCTDGFAGYKAITKHNPDLIFLDIQMPKLTGFEMLELIDNPPRIIFTTAYNEFAVKAFEANAVDYLLKPYTKPRLFEAIDKAVKQLPTVEATKNLSRQVADSVTTLARIVIKDAGIIKIIPAKDLLYVESQDDYVMLYTAEGRFLKNETMKFYENHLDAGQFVRVHRSYIVNIEAVYKLELFSKDSYILLLRNGAKISVSKAGYKKLKDVLNF
ncbi:MAG TPA: DNA-binding response regulator [Bacteroidales bacterium]|nr:DNA-binding response regulator [Bacteroidales bacterium]